jgi:hypothetical protein
MHVKPNDEHLEHPNNRCCDASLKRLSILPYLLGLLNDRPGLHDLVPIILVMPTVAMLSRKEKCRQRLHVTHGDR